MKIAVVPAQVTTIEDRIAGRLSLNQLGLLLMPLLLGSIGYVLLPPFFSYASYKLVIFTVLMAICASLAVRIKDQILLLWFVKIGRYWLRPRYFVYSKNDGAGRPLMELPQLSEEHEPMAALTKEKPTPLTMTARLQVEQLLHGTRALSYKPNKKGGVNVIIREVSTESQ